MADGLQMGNLSLQDSQHAPQGGPPGRAAYIPPHLRGRPGGASMDGPAAAAPPPGPGAGGFSGARYDILKSPLSLLLHVFCHKIFR
jgi:ATP-dependent RNA helicase DDX3X